MRLNAFAAIPMFPKRSLAVKENVMFPCSGTRKNMCQVPLVSLYASGKVNAVPVAFVYEPVTLPKLLVRDVPLGYVTITGRSRSVKASAVELCDFSVNLNCAGITDVVELMLPPFPYVSCAAQVILYGPRVAF